MSRMWTSRTFRALDTYQRSAQTAFARTFTDGKWQVDIHIGELLLDVHRAEAVSRQALHWLGALPGQLAERDVDLDRTFHSFRAPEDWRLSDQTLITTIRVSREVDVAPDAERASQKYMWYDPRIAALTREQYEPEATQTLERATAFLLGHFDIEFCHEELGRSPLFYVERPGGPPSPIFRDIAFPIYPSLGRDIYELSETLDLLRMAPSGCR